MKARIGQLGRPMNSVKFKIYKLYFTAPLHISDEREDGSISEKTVHSDTFYSALIACRAKVGMPIPEHGDLGCVISDLFPYYQLKENSNPVYFLPFPLQTTLPKLSDPADAKKVKSVRWVDASLYSKLLQGKPAFEGKREELNCIQGSYLSKSELPENSNGLKDFITSEIMQRVRIEDRTGKEPAIPYYVDRISFRDYSGLYFLVLGDTKMLDESLEILKMEGIGTDRNIGFGAFDYSIDSLTLELPEDADHQVSLSMLIPESKEQLSKLLASIDVAYNFTRRGGWITTYPFTTLRKNAIYSFLPGSVFSLDKGLSCTIIGKIVNLKPDIGELTPQYPIWRNGKSIMLPIKLQ